MLIKNDLSEVRAYKVKHVAGHVHVGGFLPSCVCFQLDSARGIGSRLLHLSPSGFAQRLTEALIIAPWGHCCSGNSWGKGDGLVDVRLSVCVSVCQSPPISPLYLLYPRGWNVHELCVSSFSGKTAGRASLAPFHVFPGGGLGSQLPAGHSVLKCLLL